MSQLLLESPPHPQPLSPRGEGGKIIRVSYLIDDLSRAGTESQLLALIRTLDRTRFEPSLVLLNGEGALSRSLEPADCPVLRLGVTRLFGVKALSAAKRLYSFWREFRPDVAQTYFLDSAYLGVPVAKLAGVRKVVRVRNNLGYWQTRKHRVLSRLVRPWVNATLTNSEQGRAALAGAGRVVVIENGVDLEKYPPPGDAYGVADLPHEGGGEEAGRGTCSALTRGAFFTSPLVREVGAGAERRHRVGGTSRVGCVANLRAVKNIDGLMRVAKRVLEHFPNATFEVAGDGEQRAALEHLYRELGLGERFILRGSVADVPAFLRSVDLAVLPSHSEGMSNAVLEYMAAGLPVIATDVGANAKLIEHGVSGLIVPPNDESALADAITKLLADPPLAVRYGDAARRRVEGEYSRDAMRRRFERFYRELVGRVE